MTAKYPHTISDNEIKSFSSKFLSDEIKKEAWIIDSFFIENAKSAFAKVSMTQCALSETDRNGFHLTIFSALEFSSQLMIIFLHHWAGLSCKTQEGWMIESRTRSVKSIRDSKNISVHMNVCKIKKINGKIICECNFTINDKSGGLFNIFIKGLLS